MDYFNYKDDQLYAENININDLAQKHHTPLYVYSKATIIRHINAFEDALKRKEHLICYAVKANSNINILKIMAQLGTGFDVVSKGELQRVIVAGGDPKKVIFSGVGKTEDEIEFAIEQNIKCLNIESENELLLVEKIASKLNRSVNVALRVNPNVDAKTHPKISTGLKNNKFGIEFERAVDLYKKIAQSKYLKACGIDCHIGSQMTSNGPILETTDKLIELYNELLANGIKVHHIDIGGGLGVTYANETPPSPYEYLNAIINKLENIDVEILIEPGRAMIANAGLLVSKVLYLKQNSVKNFCIVDAAMNDLIRPALYDSWMNIIATKIRDESARVYDVVGPVCESDDFLGLDRKLSVHEGDYIAIRGAGAYGFSMASNYNSRVLCAEVLVDDSKDILIRKRQKIEDMYKDEIIN